MISIEHDAGLVVCGPRGDLDVSNVGQLRQTLQLLSEEPRVVIDLAAVTFIDSAALGALLGFVRRIREHGGSVAIVCNRAPLLRLLTTVGFDRLVPVAMSLEDAKRTLASEGCYDSGPARGARSVTCPVVSIPLDAIAPVANSDPARN